MTPTVIQPSSAKYAPKTVTTTNEKFEIVFMSGPIEEPMLSARMPVFVRLSAV